MTGTLTEGVPGEKWWPRAQARNWRVLPWKDESSEGQTPGPDLSGELRSGPCGCCYNSVMPWYSQQCCLSSYQSELNSSRQEGADSRPLPNIATFPWIMLLWPHPYIPWGAPFSTPKWNACLSWTSLLTDWSQHPCQHSAHPKGHHGCTCGCACRFALSVAHRFTPESSLSDQ